MRVAVLDDYQNISQTVADWGPLSDRATIDVFTTPIGDEDAVALALSNYEIIVCMRERTQFPASLIAQLDRLKLIITTGMRNRSIDSDAARQRGITLCGTPGLGAPAGELACALIMALMKNIPADDQSMRSGEWQPNIGHNLGGKTLSLFGLGKLGAYVARFGLAMEMDVIAWSQNLTDKRAAEVGVRRVEKEEALSAADVLCVQLILSDRSRGLIGVSELALMKPTAFLVNTSRGPIVNENALIDALRQKRIAGAGLDVYDVEPLPINHPFRSLDNTILTPHTGYVTIENLAHMYNHVVEDIAAFIDGVPIRVLNK
ncbi:MAG: D-2-hydroxyacid dehydrogenase family protein [Pseudomonadota bacterium]|nr:D-2-hydroxyacid dehydrogenase family protein [Pseudomonadota bacterium]